MYDISYGHFIPCKEKKEKNNNLNQHNKSKVFL